MYLYDTPLPLHCYDNACLCVSMVCDKQCCWFFYLEDRSLVYISYCVWYVTKMYSTQFEICYIPYTCMHFALAMPLQIMSQYTAGYQTGFAGDRYQQRQRQPSRDPYIIRLPTNRMARDIDSLVLLTVLAKRQAIGSGAKPVNLKAFSILKPI